MIVVIADDFTGAAELAGISLRYGLKVELCVGKVEYRNADVLVISTDSRSLNKDEAIAVTEKIVKQVLLLNPEFVYKKIDSVLRGYVLDELKVQGQLMDKRSAFIMSANPSLGRAISNGEYFIDEKKISETGFAYDPEFPAKSSTIIKMLGDDTIKVLEHTDVLPAQAIVVGEATTTGDIRKWASLIDESWMLAGAGDFYSALLDKYYQPQVKKQFQLQFPHLYVCGTSFKERKDPIKDLNCVSFLPGVIDEKWLKKTGEMIRKQQKAVIAIEESAAPALELRTIMAKAVWEIIKRERIKEIFIEGGSTAAAILARLHISVLEPKNELERGVVRMKAGNLFITVKPGSYELPEEIKQLYKIGA